MRLVRLRWEADDYLKRLGTEKAVHIVQAADRERQQRSRAIELSECVVAGRDQAAYERAMRPWPQEAAHNRTMASPVVTLSQTARLYVPNVGAALCVEAGREAAAAGLGRLVQFKKN
jgi:hypothetical protein